MGLWHGRLCNTRVDVCIDSALLALLVYALLSQLPAFRQGRTSGLSKYYVLFSVLIQNAQLSQAILTAAYAWPNDHFPVLTQISDGRLSGLPAFGAVLGLLQIFLQWSCSICILLLYVRSAGPASSISTVAFLHAASTVFPAVAIALPKPAKPEMGTGIIMGLISISNLVVAPCFLVLAIYAQWQESRSRSAGSPTASMFLWQAVALAPVSHRLFWRLGHWTSPGTEPISPNLALTEWIRFFWDAVVYSYEWAFPAANVAVQAIGCAFLAICYWNQPAHMAENDAWQRLLKV